MENSEFALMNRNTNTKGIRSSDISCGSYTLVKAALTTSTCIPCASRMLSKCNLNYKNQNSSWNLSWKDYNESKPMWFVLLWWNWESCDNKSIIKKTNHVKHCFFFFGACILRLEHHCKNLLSSPNNASNYFILVSSTINLHTLIDHSLGLTISLSLNVCSYDPIYTRWPLIRKTYKVLTYHTIHLWSP